MNKEPEITMTKKEYEGLEITMSGCKRRKDMTPEEIKQVDEALAELKAAGIKVILEEVKE